MTPKKILELQANISGNILMLRLLTIDLNRDRILQIKTPKKTLIIYKKKACKLIKGVIKCKKQLNQDFSQDEKYLTELRQLK